MDRSRKKSKELRGVIAAAVKADPVTYNDGFLGKDADEYVKWIMGKDTCVAAS